MNRLNTCLSSILLSWYYGPGHVGKIRIWELIWSLLDEPRLTIPYQGGAKISVDIHDWVQKKIVEDGVYEPEVWEALAEHADEDEIVWDIGGHIGGVSIRAALHPSVRAVHAFEPHPETYDALSINVRLNPDLPIVAHNVALSAQQEYRQLHEPLLPINTGRATLAGSTEDKSSGKTKVRCTSVDYLVRSEGISPPTLVKMDVEGWESQVLLGAQWLLENHPPRAFVFEDTTASSSEQIPQTETVRLLEDAGYAITRIPRRQYADDDVDNYLAIRSV